MFVWRADTILSEIAAHLPGLFKALSCITFNGDIWELSDLHERIEAMYDAVESVSIDYGVMERSGKVQVVPVEMGWSDVGSWSALPEVLEPDAQGTVCVNAAGHVALDTSDCLIYAGGKVVATVGVKGLVVVSTPDALLLCDRTRAQDVKKVVEELAARGLDSYL
jgi:mannose-1-phosphate guanylyltransferase